MKVWEYTVLVTNGDYDLDAIGQLYRDRADCENGFDELKNQWGWGGYTTQDMERCISRRERSPWSTTGGVGMCAWRTRRHGLKRSPLARCCPLASRA